MRSKFVVRFVDIVLILLFGFIAIAQLQESSEIELPKSRNTPKAVLESAYFIAVGVTKEGLYLVNQESVALNDVSALRAFLRTESQELEAEKVQVRIRSQHDAPIRYALRAAQICDELGLAKLLDVEMAVEADS